MPQVSVLRFLTQTERQVEDSHPDVQSEEQDDICHFAEQDDVSHMLFHSYWDRETDTETRWC